eukprot:EG_transcript_11214
MDKGKGNLTDAYVQVEYGGQKQKTRTIKDDLNPRWEQTLTFPLGSDPDITLKVYDDDPLIDDYIGQTIVPLSRVPFEDWLQLTNKKSLPVGYLLVRVDDGSGGRSGGAGVAGAAAGAGAVAGGGAGAAAGSRYGQDRAYDRYDRSNRDRDYPDRGYPNKYDKLYDRHEARRTGGRYGPDRDPYAYDRDGYGYEGGRYGYNRYEGGKGRYEGGYSGGKGGAYYGGRGGYERYDDVPSRWREAPPRSPTRRDAYDRYDRYDRYGDAPRSRYSGLPPVYDPSVGSVDSFVKAHWDAFGRPAATTYDYGYLPAYNGATVYSGAPVYSSAYSSDCVSCQPTTTRYGGAVTSVTRLPASSSVVDPYYTPRATTSYTLPSAYVPHISSFSRPLPATSAVVGASGPSPFRPLAPSVADGIVTYPAASRSRVPVDYLPY